MKSLFLAVLFASLSLNLHALRTVQLHHLRP